MGVLKLKQILFITAGIITLILGTVGIILPVLPTTPFYLLTCFFFANGSPKFHNWFTGTNLYKQHLESFVNEKSMPLKSKITILASVSALLLIPFFAVDSLHLRIFLILLVGFKYYYFIFKIKTR